MVQKLEIGAQLREGRKKIGLTLEEVGNLIDCSPSYVNLLENNKRKSPGIEVLSALADLYKLDIDVLRGKKTPNENEDVNKEMSIDVREELDVSLKHMTDIKNKLDTIVLLLEENNDTDLHAHLLKESKNLNFKIKGLQKSLSYSLYQFTK